MGIQSGVTELVNHMKAELAAWNAALQVCYITYVILFACYCTWFVGIQCDITALLNHKFFLSESSKRK
jgi:hypothetical protein